MELVKPNNPILTTTCQQFNFQEPPFDPVEFSRELVKHMYEWNGLGLAANQVGVPYRIFAMRGHPENFVCFNPRIVLPSTQEVELEEGCLTYPGLIVKIKRAQHVKVRFQLPNTEMVTRTFTGMTARIFQHEMEHVEGLIFYNKASRIHRDRALEKWRKGKKVVANVVPDLSYYEHILRR